MDKITVEFVPDQLSPLETVNKLKEWLHEAIIQKEISMFSMEYKDDIIHVEDSETVACKAKKEFVP